MVLLVLVLSYQIVNNVNQEIVIDVLSRDGYSYRFCPALIPYIKQSAIRIPYI